MEVIPYLHSTSTTASTDRFDLCVRNERDESCSVARRVKETASAEKEKKEKEKEEREEKKKTEKKERKNHEYRRQYEIDMKEAARITFVDEYIKKKNLTSVV